MNIAFVFDGYFSDQAVLDLFVFDGYVLTSVPPPPPIQTQYIYSKPRDEDGTGGPDEGYSFKREDEEIIQIIHAFLLCQN